MQLAQRVLDAGERLIVSAPEARLDELDTLLWTHEPASFLAHGRAGGPDDARQPILLSGAIPVGHGARHLMLIDRPLPDAAAGHPRIYLLFDDGTPGHEAARAAWRDLAAGESMRSYWQQKAEGGWAQRG